MLKVTWHLKLRLAQTHPVDRLTMVATVIVFALSANAGENDCTYYKSQALLACTTTDTTAGMQGGESAQAQQLLGQISSLNQQSTQISTSNESAGPGGKTLVYGTTAAAAKNEQQRADVLSQLSSLKANACDRARRACQQSCSTGIAIHSIRSRMASILDPDTEPSEENDLVSSRNDGNTTCGDYQKNVTQALSQLQSELNSSQVNGEIKNGSQSDGQSHALNLSDLTQKNLANPLSKTVTLEAAPRAPSAANGSSTEAAEPSSKDFGQVSEYDNAGSNDQQASRVGTAGSVGGRSGSRMTAVRSKEISPSNGPSNFEKIHSHYENLKGSLIPE